MIEAVVRARGAVVRRGGDYDAWDLEVCGNVFGNTRIRVLSEEYDGGKQMVVAYAYPRFSSLPVIWIALLFLLSTLALVDHAWIAAGALGTLSATLGVLACRSLGLVTAAVSRCLGELGFGEQR